MAARHTVVFLFRVLCREAAAANTRRIHHRAAFALPAQTG